MDNQVSKLLEELGVFPIVVIHRIEDVDPLAEALLKANLPCIEVTFRTEVAEAALRRLAKGYPELLLGAGTILREDQAKAAADAGAKFLLSPGFNPKTVEFCLDGRIPIFPGVCTPSEMELALSHGLTDLKFFPAEAMGGIKYLKAVTGPLPMIRFIPTGGLNPQNLKDYLEFNRTLACAGSWIAPHKLVSEKRFGIITQNATEALQAVFAVRGERKR